MISAVKKRKNGARDEGLWKGRGFDFHYGIQQSSGWGDDV